MIIYDTIDCDGIPSTFFRTKAEAEAHVKELTEMGPRLGGCIDQRPRLRRLEVPAGHQAFVDWLNAGFR